jgi:hypothetical protein
VGVSELVRRTRAAILFPMLLMPLVLIQVGRIFENAYPGAVVTGGVTVVLLGAVSWIGGVLKSKR